MESTAQPLALVFTALVLRPATLTVHPTPVTMVPATELLDPMNLTWLTRSTLVLTVIVVSACFAFNVI